jgi:hypothetical protein
MKLMELCVYALAVCLLWAPVKLLAQQEGLRSNFSFSIITQKAAYDSTVGGADFRLEAGDKSFSPSLLPDHGANLQAIRAAFLDGYRLGRSAPLQNVSCTAATDPRSIEFWVIFKDGLVVTYDATMDAIRINHIDNSWLKQHPEGLDVVLMSKRADNLDLDEVRVAGSLTQMVVRQPCLSNDALLKLTGPNAAQIHNVSAIPPPPIPPR